jgi:hypothetical protein
MFLSSVGDKTRMGLVGWRQNPVAVEINPDAALSCWRSRKKGMKKIKTKVMKKAPHQHKEGMVRVPWVPANGHVFYLSADRHKEQVAPSPSQNCACSGPRANPASAAQRSFFRSIELRFQSSGFGRQDEGSPQLMWRSRLLRCHFTLDVKWSTRGDYKRAMTCSFDFHEFHLGSSLRFQHTKRGHVA